MEPRPDPVLHIGCAGWSIPKLYAGRFPVTGSHLQRYATHLPAVEINSSFYTAHKPETYARWATEVPAAFRFAVKVPKQITHIGRLADPSALDPFLEGVRALGDRLGPLLVQLPPSLAFAREQAEGFFAALRKRFDGDVACEPRHPSWFTAEAERLLAAWQVARVAADPARVPEAAKAGGWAGLIYYRLHGSPRTYYSAYSTAFLEALLAELIRAVERAQVWCIFDNTALGAATDNALTLLEWFEARGKFQRDSFPAAG